MLARCWTFLLTEFSNISNRACAVELLFGVFAQLGTCSSVRTGIVFIALVIAWLVCTCVVCLLSSGKEKKEKRVDALQFVNHTLLQPIINFSP